MVEGVKKLADQMVLTQCGRSSGYRRFLDSHKHGSGGATNYYTGQNVTKRKGKKCKGLERTWREGGGRKRSRQGKELRVWVYRGGDGIGLHPASYSKIRSAR
jgi:hypothetical protein